MGFIWKLGLERHLNCEFLMVDNCNAFCVNEGRGEKTAMIFLKNAQLWKLFTVS